MTDTGLFRAKVPGSTRQVVHLFRVEEGYLSVRSLCQGVEADPAHLERVPPYQAVDCPQCSRVPALRTAEHSGQEPPRQGSLF